MKNVKCDETRDFGKKAIHDFDHKMSADEKDKFARKFPEKVKLDLPIMGETSFDIRRHVRDLLDSLPYPTLRAKFEVEGSCSSEKDVVIECTKEKMLGTSHGTFQILGVGISYEFHAEVDPGEYSKSDCACTNSKKKGWRRSRKFDVDWSLSIDMNPGVGGSYEVETQSIVVCGPCCGCDDEDSTPNEVVSAPRKKSAQRG